MDRRVRDAATRLYDEKLIAKLSEGDLVATEARYHKSCLIALYNRLLTACSKSPADFEDEILYGIVITEVVDYIKESESNKSSTHYLSDKNRFDVLSKGLSSGISVGGSGKACMFLYK